MISICMLCSKQMQQSNASPMQAIYSSSNVILTSELTRVSYSQSVSDTKRCGTPAQKPERPVLHPRDEVFWNTTLLDKELNNFLLPKIWVQGVYYNASGARRRSSLLLKLATKLHQAPG